MVNNDCAPISSYTSQHRRNFVYNLLENSVNVTSGAFLWLSGYLTAQAIVSSVVYVSRRKETTFTQIDNLSSCNPDDSDLFYERPPGNVDAVGFYIESVDGPIATLSWIVIVSNASLNRSRKANMDMGVTRRVSSF